MKKPWNKLFYRSMWCLLTMFFAILLAIVCVGENVAVGYAGWINSFLGIDPTIQVDDSSNETPDVMYYPSDFRQWRWHWNEAEQRYEFETRWNTEGLYSYIKDVAKDVDTEGAVLLKNENDALPLKDGAKISLFGISQLPSNYITTGNGSGAHDANTSDTLRTMLVNSGIEVNPDLYNRYEILGQSHSKAMFNTFPGGDLNYVEYAVNEANASEFKDIADSTVSSYGDSAVFIISRLGSENGDTDFDTSTNSGQRKETYVDNNYLDLTEDEISVLELLKSYKEAGKIKNIVLVLNTCTSMQFKTISQYPIDAILWSGTGGTSSYRALAEVLTGEADPNGHLADTYAFDNYSAPSTVNTGDFTYAQSAGVPATETYAHSTKYVVYQEGIYVGYKYYETRYEDMVMNEGNAVGSFGAKNSQNVWTYSEEVAYPFGYGSSYADFEWSDFSVSANNGYFTASITIKNVSDTYSGKDVFQLYLQKPYTDYDVENNVEKASVELVGFEKTKLLAPGEEQTLQITVDLSDFVSYDSYGAGTYILEKGDYYLIGAHDSHDAVNNVIAAKGAVNEGYMDAEGNEDMTYKYSVAADDFTTYSVSAVTNNPIVNQFDDVDLNRYEHTADQKITYLSRSNWEATYPTEAVSLTCTDAGMIEDMKYSTSVTEDPDAKMPTYGADNGLSLINLLYEDYDSEQWDKLLDQLTIDDYKNLILLGSNQIAGASSVNAPGGNVHDGPAGIRDAAGSVAYPGQIVMACTWNTDLIEQLGEAFGMEMQYLGYVGLYGPGANIHRNAFGGRNFEYYSEDGVLSGYMLNAELKGLAGMGIITYTKHFALNEQERNRYGVCTWANEQSIREIYLKAFEYSITDEECGTVGLMSSFNRLGCTWSGAHSGLLTGVLRDEWGFKGSVMTDAAVAGYMGANGNTAAVAEAIVAGQTIWLGDQRSAGFGGYEDNPTVAQAMRKAVKANLYAQLHSAAINGMKSSTKIIEITPWWQTALKGAQIAVGIITGLCAAMAIASFVVVYTEKRKEVKNV